MTITNTISTLASIGTAVNAADVTTPDNELLALINNLVNGSGDTEQILWDQISTPATPASTKWKQYFKSGGLYSLDSSGGESLITPSHAVCEGRLTLTSGTPVTTTDVTAATTVYFTPYNGNRLAVYNGSFWIIKTFSELSITMALATASTPYDIFVYDNAGTLTLEKLAWTNDTTRATALTTQDGVYVKSGATTRRYLGTVRTTSTIGQTEDSFTKRFVWNLYNRRTRVLRVRDTTDSWTYATAAYRPLNNSTSNRVEFVRGLAEDPVQLINVMAMTQTGSVSGAAGIGIGSTTVNSAFIYTTALPSFLSLLWAFYRDIPAVGYNYLQPLEYSTGATVTFYGDSGVTYLQTGAIGEMAA